MSNLQDHANLAAVALVRQAIEYSDAGRPSGNVMEVLVPYLRRAWELAGTPGETFDAEPALRRLLATLAQLAGVTYHKLQVTEKGRDLSKEELLAALDGFGHALAADPGEATA